LQSCGRGSRVAEGKSCFTVIDLGLNLERHDFWSADRDWSKYFKIKKWVKKLPSDDLNVWECGYYNAFNLKGTLYNEELNRVECYNCHNPKPENAPSENHIHGELEEVKVPRIPRAKSIVRYGVHCGNDANISFRLLDRKIIDLFYHHTDREDYIARKYDYIKRVYEIYRPCYFAIINSNLKGANRTLKTSVNRIITKLDKHYK
tara:strand:- start:255 stop:866 length:612 start_codon:yes stop_codon:yes gene_type:complete